MKKEKFIKIGALLLMLYVPQAQAGFMSSYVLGVPTSTSPTSIAGAALSNSTNESVMPDNYNYSFVRLDFEKPLKKLDSKIVEQLGYDKSEQNNIYEIFLEPNESITINYLWQKKSNDEKEQKLLKKDEIKDKFLAIYPNIYINPYMKNDNFETNHLDDKIILTNKNSFRVHNFIYLKNNKNEWTDSVVYMKNVQKELLMQDINKEKKSDALNALGIFSLGLIMLPIINSLKNNRKKEKLNKKI